VNKYLFLRLEAISSVEVDSVFRWWQPVTVDFIVLFQKSITSEQNQHPYHSTVKIWFLHVYIGPLFSALEVVVRRLYIEGRTRDQLPIKLCPRAW